MKSSNGLKKRLKTHDLVNQVKVLPDLAHDSKFREEFGREMTGHYMRDQFVALRKNCKQFGDDGMTQTMLAQIMGVHPSWVSDFENARIDNPELKTLMRYASALGGVLEVRVVPHSYFPTLNDRCNGHHPQSYIPSFDEENNVERKRAIGY